MVTQLDIARKLGVSRQLVTFALAGYPQVSQESRKLILATAEKMGYRPNPYARALKEGKTGIVALWIPNQISSHFAHVTREMTRLVKADHAELIVSEVGTSRAEQILSHVPVDGIFVVDAPDQAKEYLRTHPKGGLPLISMGANVCTATDFVSVDLYQGALEAIRHLVAVGYRRIAHMTFVKGGGSREQERRSGYLEAMKEALLKPEFIYYPLSDNQRPIVRAMIQDYIRQQGRPEGIFCHSDDVAVGIYRGLADMGLKVPTDVALVGCDGIQDTEYLDCPLTTLIQPVQAMCSTAWQFFKYRQADPTLPRQQADLKPRLVVRASTRR